MTNQVLVPLRQFHLPVTFRLLHSSNLLAKTVATTTALFFLIARLLTGGLITLRKLPHESPCENSEDGKQKEEKESLDYGSIS